VPYSQTWKDLGFKKRRVYGYYAFSAYERRMVVASLKRQYGKNATFCTGDSVEFI